MRKEDKMYQMRKDHQRMFIVLVLLSALPLMFTYLQLDNKLPSMMRYSKSKIRQLGDTLRNTFINHRPVLSFQDECLAPHADVNSTIKLNPLFDNFTKHSLEINRAWQSPSKVIHTHSDVLSPSFTLFYARTPAIVYHKDIFFIFCEARLDSIRDYGRIVLRRGIRKGLEVEWKKLQVIASLSNVSTMNPSPVVDRQRDVILVVFSTFPTDMDLNKLLELQGKPLSDVYIIKSYDLGISWTKPISITTNTIAKLEPFPTLFVPGPGHSIQLTCGRIIVPGNYFQVDKYSKEYPNFCSNCTSYSNIFYSDDGGVSWHVGGTTPYTQDMHGTPVQPNEVQAVELNNGVVCLNSRTLNADHTRSQAYSFDGGVTLTKPLLTSVIEPGYDSKWTKVRKRRWATRWKPAAAGGCGAGLIRFPTPDSNSVNAKYWMILSNPADKKEKKNMSVRLSRDDCSTWSEPWVFKEILAGYSDITVFEVTINKQKHTFFAVVFECGTHSHDEYILFKMFNLEAVVQGINEQSTKI